MHILYWSIITWMRYCRQNNCSMEEARKKRCSMCVCTRVVPFFFLWVRLES